MTTALEIATRKIGATILVGTLTGMLVAGAGCTAADADTIATAALRDGQSDGQDPAKRAEAILAESAAAYKKVPGLTDLARLEITTPDGKQAYEMSYAFGAGTDGCAQLMGMTVASLGKRAVVMRDDVDDKYLEVPLDSTLLRTLDTLMRGFRLPSPFVLRDGTGPAEYADSFGLGVLRDPTIEGYEKTTDKDGRAMHTIHIGARNGVAMVHIDDVTRFLSTIELTAKTPTGAEVHGVLRFAPRVHKSPAGLVKLPTDGRTRVVSIAELAPTPIAKGDKAPDFTLESSDGHIVMLSELRGKVVVLDFWATWCGPCRLGMPALQQFDTWARKDGKPIAVFAVDTFERVETIEVMRTAAEKYWTSQEFTMDNLLDFGNEVIMDYGYASIPTTLIIDPQGIVAEVHTGFDPKMFERLKQEVTALMPGG